jgi:hypothetical protein
MRALQREVVLLRARLSAVELEKFETMEGPVDLANVWVRFHRVAARICNKTCGRICRVWRFIQWLQDSILMTLYPFFFSGSADANIYFGWTVKDERKKAVLVSNVNALLRRPSDQDNIRYTPCWTHKARGWSCVTQEEQEFIEHGPTGLGKIMRWSQIWSKNVFKMRQPRHHCVEFRNSRKEMKSGINMSFPIDFGRVESWYRLLFQRSPHLRRWYSFERSDLQTLKPMFETCVCKTLHDVHTYNFTFLAVMYVHAMFQNFIRFWYFEWCILRGYGGKNARNDNFVRSDTNGSYVQYSCDK